jgi:hypothetical protein
VGPVVALVPDAARESRISQPLRAASREQCRSLQTRCPAPLHQSRAQRRLSRPRGNRRRRVEHVYYQTLLGRLDLRTGKVSGATFRSEDC